MAARLVRPAGKVVLHLWRACVLLAVICVPLASGAIPDAEFQYHCGKKMRIATTATPPFIFLDPAKVSHGCMWRVADVSSYGWPLIWVY